MEPTDRQQEVIDLGRVADKPIAWLGKVREGKTTGGCFALLHRMQEVPGDYGVFTYSGTNWNNSLRPTILKLLDYWGEPYLERKVTPKSIETEYGKILVFTASDRGMEKVLQGTTLQGALADEILLYPRNVVMQIVARFTFDKPWFLMTANKDNPYHWIKTNWIDKGKVIVVNSEAGDNPHLSGDAEHWRNELLSGHFADRMMGNEWSSEMNQVSMPVLRGSSHPPMPPVTYFDTFWVDDARYNVVLKGHMKNGNLTFTDVNSDLSFNELEEILRWHKPSIGNWLGDIAKQPRGSNVALMRPEFEIYARSFSRLAEKVFFNPSLKDVFNECANWSYRAASEHDLGASLTATPPEVLAVAQGVHHMLRSAQPISLGRPL